MLSLSSPAGSTRARLLTFLSPACRASTLKSNANAAALPLLLPLSSSTAAANLALWSRERGRTVDGRFMTVISSQLVKSYSHHHHHHYHHHLQLLLTLLQLHLTFTRVKIHVVRSKMSEEQTTALNRQVTHGSNLRTGTHTCDS
jgi:hypothetical protein